MAVTLEALAEIERGTDELEFAVIHLPDLIDRCTVQPFDLLHLSEVEAARSRRSRATPGIRDELDVADLERHGRFRYSELGSDVDQCPSRRAQLTCSSLLYQLAAVPHLVILTRGCDSGTDGALLRLEELSEAV